MSAVATALAELDDTERHRVLRWAVDRYNIALSSSGRPASGGGGAGEVPDQDDSDGAEDNVTAGTPTFGHFAELFAAAHPKLNEDKALVAAYWLQEIQGKEVWQSRALTTELKNMGHAIPNITDALTSNMRKNPQRIIQLQKTGNSRQAQKVYKVTHEGLVFVRAMLDRDSQ